MAIRAALIILILVAFFGVGQCDFVHLDDGGYVTENPMVQAGLTWTSFRWAWTTFHVGYWQPVTWLSLQADASFHGLDPAGFHWTNLALHAVNGVLLFDLLRRMTRTVWRSAATAALWAVHPLRVESVAWVTERKDVLSTLFGLLALWAYVEYVRSPRVARYLLVGLFLSLGLMAKPMLVTVPAVLLLLDWWPLGRLRGAPGTVPGEAGPVLSRPGVTWRWLVAEKVPLLVLVVAFGLVTTWAQAQVGAVTNLELVPIRTRLANAVVSYAEYLRMTSWPVGLAPLYPHPGESLTAWQVVGSSMLLVVVTGIVVGGSRRWPYAAVGWLWFLGTLVPVIGLVQVGNQARADRFTYWPHVGLMMMAAWGLHQSLARWKGGTVILGIGELAMIGIWVALTQQQVGCWRNDASLWQQTVAATDRNDWALNNLGIVRLEQGKVEEAREHFTLAIRYNPRNGHAHRNLGKVCLLKGELESAAHHFRKALEISSNFEGLHHQLGQLLMQLGQTEEAAAYLELATRLQPGNSAAWADWGAAHVHLGKLEDAITCFRVAIHLQPREAEYYCSLGYALHETGQVLAAIEQYRNAGRINPDWHEHDIRLAWTFATDPDPAQRSGQGAVYLALRACQATERSRPDYLDVLAAAYAEGGRFPEAIRTAQEGIDRAQAAGRKQLANQIQDRLKLYRDRMPYHQPMVEGPR